MYRENQEHGKSKHEVLFFYGGAHGGIDMLVKWGHYNPAEPGYATTFYGPSPDGLLEGGVGDWAGDGAL